MPQADDYDDYNDLRDRPNVPFPPGVRAAGIIWICVGVLGILNTVLTFALTAAEKAANQGQPGQGNAYGGGGCGVLIAIGFLVVGFQTVKGTAKGTLGNGIGSLVLGVVDLGLAVLLLVLSTQVPGAPQPLLFVSAGLIGLLGLALLIAGILAIAGRTAYADWLEAQGRGPRRRRRTVEEEDYDDQRPRRPRRDYPEDDDR